MAAPDARPDAGGVGVSLKDDQGSGKSAPASVLYLSGVYGQRLTEESDKYAVSIENDTADSPHLAPVSGGVVPCYRELVEESPALICRLSADLKIQFANKTLCRFFKRDLHALIGNHWLDLIHPSDRAGYLQRVQGLSPTKPGITCQLRCLLPNGDVSWLFCVETALFEADRLIGYHVVAADFTELRAARARRTHAARMAAIGALATGLAHELNQPLNVMRLALQNTLRHIGDGPVDTAFLQAKLERIDRQIGRAAAIVDQMQIFGRKASFEPAEFDPTVSIEGALGLLKDVLAEQNLAINWQRPTSPRRAVGFADQVEQIISSLVSNAVDAIGERYRQGGLAAGQGVIAIELVDDPQVESLCVVVRDNGGGIPEDVIDKIFEPFFTTKPVGKGTGLGLSLAFGMLQDMGGSISAANCGDGAEFRVYLPAAERSADG